MVGFHNELRICKGILNAPGDTGSAESGYTIIDLLSGSAEGFALQSDVGGWDPQLPAPKAGLWNDVSFTDGRVPYAGAEGNVTETMRVTISASTPLRLSELLSDLYDMIEDVKRFWFDEFNCEPVFLWWWAHGAPGRQFALVMSIDVDVSIPGTDDVGSITRDITLTIEREPFWRGEVAPGANPIYWTLFASGKQPGLDYDYTADLRIMRTNALDILHWLAQDTIENKVEFSSLSANANVLLSENRLTIPAASIPGDAPALLQLSISHTFPSSALDPQNFLYLVARSTRDTTRVARNGNASRYLTMVPFTAGMYAANVIQADGGGLSGFNLQTGTTIAFQRLAITPSASPTYAQSWIAAFPLDKNLQRGRFAVFARCRQNAGSSGDILMRARFSYDSNATPQGVSVVTTPRSAPVQTGTGDTTWWNLAYLGSVRLPLDRDETVSSLGAVGGTGRFNAAWDQLYVSLETTRVSGVALLYFIDLILLPYDETLLDTDLVAPLLSSGSVTESVLIDNTGYLSRGKPQQIAVAINNLGVTANDEMDALQQAIEQNGSQLTLEPGVDNHLYVLEKTANGTSRLSSTIVMSANIVPRWRGIRTV